MDRKNIKQSLLDPNHSFEHTSSGSTFERMTLVSGSSTPKHVSEKKFLTNAVTKSHLDFSAIDQRYFDIE